MKQTINETDVVLAMQWLHSLGDDKLFVDDIYPRAYSEGVSPYWAGDCYAGYNRVNKLVRKLMRKNIVEQFNLTGDYTKSVKAYRLLDPSDIVKRRMENANKCKK
jgi:hypothetical protein